MYLTLYGNTSRYATIAAAMNTQGNYWKGLIFIFRKIKTVAKIKNFWYDFSVEEKTEEKQMAKNADYITSLSGGGAVNQLHALNTAV